MEFDELSNRVIGCAIEVHRALGPGLLESTYGQCLAHHPNLFAKRTMDNACIRMYALRTQ